MINRTKEKYEYTGGQLGTHKILRHINCETHFSVDIHQKEGKRERGRPLEGLKAEERGGERGGKWLTFWPDSHREDGRGIRNNKRDH